jgi:hypothetical protein
MKIALSRKHGSSFFSFILKYELVKPHHLQLIIRGEKSWENKVSRKCKFLILKKLI